MAVALEGFSHWLGNKLRDLNTDESVFGSYIVGILDSDETTDEKNEAMQGILSEIVENETNINELCTEILDMYLNFKLKEAPPPSQASYDVDVKLAKLLESQCLQTTKAKTYTEEEKKIREAILSQYSEMTDDEDEEDEAHVATQQESKMEKNTNALVVAQAEKEKRENARVQSAQKKEKDKEDREKQKQMKEDKKEKRKTVKGEKRR